MTATALDHVGADLKGMTSAAREPQPRPRNGDQAGRIERSADDGVAALTVRKPALPIEESGVLLERAALR
ncbi:hypothetical protein GCM10010532_028520 [Dactylosporangium siamense]|uniref:Uncharacterized protein n=1 Tax=Dactylosporangium siamense TaxID=685454 RepID=A0A919U8M5_9ACTN|nr:hypothetical protein Dsi01nite_003670 [Dactylosporangium siamense]